MGGRQPSESEGVLRSAEASQAYVRVLGTRLGRFVEFEFSLGDGDLAVELILPLISFEEFRRERNAVLLPPAGSIAAELDRLAWRAGQPGLLRRPSSAPTDST